jgi:hypothetical protein
MSVTVNVNSPHTLVHKDSNGIASCFPDVCKTPSPGGPMPIPYANVARSSDAADCSTSVTADGNPIMLKDSSYSTSSGDEAGTAGGGVVSNCTKGKAQFALYSFDVKIEGQNVPRQSDLMKQNGQGQQFNAV